jgi:hypothetical protein
MSGLVLETDGRFWFDNVAIRILNMLHLPQHGARL